MGFRAFFDDSGSGVPVFVLSGYIDPVSRWEKFSEEWQALLDEPPKLKYFKMREAAQLCDEFAGMKVHERNRRIQKFFRLIRDSVHLSASCVIPMGPFKRIWKGNIKGDKEWNDPYFVALAEMITLWTEQHTRVRAFELFAQKEGNPSSSYGVLEFIFDDNKKLVAIVPPYYRKIRDQIIPPFRNWIGVSPRFEDDKDFLPLQACDAQSWYFRRLFAEKFNNEPFKPDLPKSCFEAFDDITSLMSFFGPERMRKVISKAPPEKKPARRFKDIHDVLANADFGETK